MIEGSKQQQLTFDKGITNVPSDLLCSDSALEESVGMTYDDGEHRPIQNPELFVTKTMNGGSEVNFHVLYVHKFDNKERYVGYYYDDSIGIHANIMRFAEKNGNNLEIIGTLYDDSGNYAVRYTSPMKVTSVGKTLILSDSNGMTYHLWQDVWNNIANRYVPVYTNIGQIPDPQFNFWIRKARLGWSAEVGDDRKMYLDENRVVVNTGESAEIILERDYGAGVQWNNFPYVGDGKIEEYNNLVIGLYSRNHKCIAEKKMFSKPFVIRTALKLYDDSYTHISQPIMVFPSVTRNTFGFYVVSKNSLRMITDFGELFFTQKKNFKNWSDIIKEVVIFASKGIETYSTSEDQGDDGRLLVKGYNINGIYNLLNTDLNDRSDYHVDNPQIDGDVYVYIERTILGNRQQEYIGSGYIVSPLKEKTEEDILNELKSTSLFYKLCEVGLEEINTKKSICDYIEPNTLENLTTQEFIDADDYFSRSKLYPDFIYSYNSRLNIANVARGMFEGFGNFLVYDNPGSPSTYDFYVRIKTDTKTIWVHHQEITSQKQGIYFFYPDPRAERVTIYKGGTCVCDAELTEHPALNGSYYLKGLPGVTVQNEQATPDSTESFNPNRTSPNINNSTDNDFREQLPNYIITSEVNNPWVFKAEGYNSVGTGKIIGVSTTTTALSQGQFGQYPLLVFSDEGIWAMSVNNTGLFSSIHPMSREVCNNPGSITQTDGAVFFSSEKGLMVVVGGDVKCVSEQLSGKEHDFSGKIAMGNFIDYLKGAFIAYDYRDSLLWIFNNSRTHVVDGSTVPYNTDYCYVYAIKSGTFGKYHFANAIESVVNFYPDYLLQSGNRLYSLTRRDNINVDNTAYAGLMITRPMKLENGLALKSIMQIRNIRDMDGTMTLRIFASNNIKDWVELTSLRGMPWKYYRFRYDFTGMAATDKFSGTVLITQERRTNKLR